MLPRFVISIAFIGRFGKVKLSVFDRKINDLRLVLVAQDIRNIDHIVIAAVVQYIIKDRGAVGERIFRSVLRVKLVI